MKKLLLLLAGLTAHAQLQVISDATLPAAVGGGPWTGYVTVVLNNPGQAQPLLYGSTPLLGWTQTVCIGITRSDCTSTVAAGTLAISLYANSTITPAGTSYKATFTPQRGGSLGNETWVVGVGHTSLAQIRVNTVPSPSVLFNLSQIRQSGATTGQCAAWNGTQWSPAACGSSGGSGLTWGELTGITWGDLQ